MGDKVFLVILLFSFFFLHIYFPYINYNSISSVLPYSSLGVSNEPRSCQLSLKMLTRLRAATPKTERIFYRRRYSSNWYYAFFETLCTCVCEKRTHEIRMYTHVSEHTAQEGGCLGGFVCS